MEDKKNDLQLARQITGQDLIPATLESLVPKAPANLAANDEQQIRSEVAITVRLISESMGDRNFVLGLENFKREIQTAAQAKIELIESRVNQVARYESPQGLDIPQVVAEMRSGIDQLDPKRAERHWFWKIISVIPGTNSIQDWWWSSGLRQILIQRETVRARIKKIVLGLQGNRQVIQEDSKQLGILHNQIESGSMFELQKAAYNCELVLQDLLEMQNQLGSDNSNAAQLRRVIETFTVRASNFRRTENALEQALTVVDITIDGNRKISESLEETSVFTSEYLTVAMALYQALAHQQRAIKVLILARRGTADVMQKTGEMAQESVAVVNEQYFNPVEMLNQIEQSQAKLMNALQSLEDASRNGAAAARQGIGKLQQATSELRTKRQELLGGVV